ncbi:MAG: VWA domain-containing protein [Congregibacter sp.]
MQSSLLRFVEILRSHSLPVSPAETIDAAAAMQAVGYADRNLLRDALAQTLAKSEREEHTFRYCFDQFFDQQLADFSQDEASNSSDPDATDETDSGQEEKQSSAGPDGDSGTSSGGGSGGAATPGDTDQQELALAAQDSPALQKLLDGELLPALMENERGTLSTAMRQAAREAGLDDIRLFTQKGQYTRRILDALGEGDIRDAVIELERAQSNAIDTLRRYRDVLREQVRDFVEQQYLLNAEGHNSAFMEDILSKTRLSNIDRRHRDRVREQVQRMARRLASRHSARRRPVKRGQLHMARTLRSGMAHDGILFKTHWRARKRDKAQLLAICDVSGSVAAYAGFLLMFLYSLQDVLPRTRSFAFSSHLGEISELFKSEPLERAIELANWRYGGATDYGSSLRDFAKLALDDINRNTSVIILGDARNNRGNPELEIMQSIYQRSKQVIWLNPESRRAWGTGDSEMLRYMSACNYSAPCGNLQQLERVVDQLLKSLR